MLEFVNFYKETCKNDIRMALNIWINLEMIDILIMLSLSIHEVCDFQHSGLIHILLFYYSDAIANGIIFKNVFF